MAEQDNSFSYGFCDGGKWEAEFGCSLIGSVLYDLVNRRWYRSFWRAPGLYVPELRNRIAAGHHGNPAKGQWLLMLDTDVHFASDLPYRLIDSANEVGAKVMSAIYFGYPLHNEPDRVCPIWYEACPPEDHTELRIVSAIDFNKPQKLAGVGMGCCLIHRDVLNAMHEKYKDEPLVWFDQDLMKFNNQLRRAGEDLAFSKRARACGFDVWGDARIVVAHKKARFENAVTFSQSLKLAKS